MKRVRDSPSYSVLRLGAFPSSPRLSSKSVDGALLSWVDDSAPRLQTMSGRPLAGCTPCSFTCVKGVHLSFFTGWTRLLLML